jgi:hypothetical protein
LYDATGLIDLWECSPDLLIATQPTSQASDDWSGLLNLEYKSTIKEKTEQE